MFYILSSISASLFYDTCFTCTCTCTCTIHVHVYVCEWYVELLCLSVLLCKGVCDCWYRLIY